MQQQQDFDALRREATKLERQLEDKVSKYQQLAQTMTTSTTSSTTTTTTMSSSIDLEVGGSNNNNNNLMMISHEEEVLQKDIQRTLNTLSDLISQQLGPAADRSGKAQHLLLVKRYREILFDLTTDFTKTSVQLQRKRQYQELLQGSSNVSGDNNANNNNNDEAMTQLLREGTSIQNSLTTSQGIIAQASETYQDLRQQGMSMKGVGSTMSRLSNSAIPTLNKLTEAIRRKRSRDDYIVAIVIAICILFTLWYMFG